MRLHPKTEKPTRLPEWASAKGVLGLTYADVRAGHATIDQRGYMVLCVPDDNVTPVFGSPQTVG